MKPQTKTFKRELAFLMCVGLFALAGFAMWPTDPALVDARAAVVSGLAFPVLAYAAAAFGMDWAGKQSPFQARAQYERPLDEPFDLARHGGDLRGGIDA
ncbi:MAG: hypothetical protein AAGG72_02705 [Pseudomonadota bacterium]